MGMGCSSSSHVIVPVSEEEALCRTGENCMNATDGVSIIDDAEAIRLFQMAAQKNHPRAIYNLARLISAGRGATSDGVAIKNAWNLYRRAADLGDPDALFHVASVYDAGTERVENENEDLKLITFRLYRLAADQGHSEAQYKMAEMHETGHDAVVDRNLIEALKLYTQAAENGNLRAQIKLGKIYTYGYGKKVKQNDFKALKWFEKACINGNIGYLTTESHKELVCEARYQLGLLLMRTGDKTNAVLQFRAAVDQCGHLDAMFQLGLCHDQGKGVSRNDAEAVRFYTLASDQGQPDAMFFLGAMHEYGRVDGAKDLIKAFQLYHEAAQRGNADAQFKMEVERDRAAQNDPDAVKLMAEIDNKPIKKVYKIKPQSQGPNFPALND